MISSSPVPAVMPGLSSVFPVAFAFDRNSTFWRDHLKKVICTWLPTCVATVDEPRWLGNFDLAAQALRGEEPGPYGDGHWEAPEMFGYADSVVHNTLESLCWACMLDAGGDAEIESAQKQFRSAIDEWVGRILPAQEEDGLMHTYITVRGPEFRNGFGQHFFYCQAYFIEAGIAHYRMTGKTDPVLFHAARRCADKIINAVEAAGDRVIVPHAGIEYTFFLLSALIEEEEGEGAGRKYAEMSKRLCDNRGSLPDHVYCQNHRPVIEQSDAVGHAVRATYLYAGMADVVRVTGDPDYSDAVQRLWSSAVDRRMYVTGGVGACDETEAFDEDYLLPNAYKPCYSESCAACGMVFWQQRMNQAYRDAKYIDVLELALYNTILGSVGEEGKTHYYRNPLDAHELREPWIGSCCQGNIARTFASLGNYVYARGESELYVNLFVGCTGIIDDIAGTSVEVVQTTNYPWDGAVSIVLNPREDAPFTVKLRIPNRKVSKCYQVTPELPKFISLSVNGEDWTGVPEHGYAAITRTWKAGDRIELVLPMDVQRVRSHAEVEANTGRVAFMRGPLVYAFEDCDNGDALETLAIPADAEFRPTHDPDLLNGVTTLTGMAIRDRSAETTETAAMAIPYFARLNRGNGRAMVWVEEDG